MKNQWELLKNHMLNKMKTQPVFKRTTTHSLRSQRVCKGGHGSREEDEKDRGGL